MGVIHVNHVTISTYVYSTQIQEYIKQRLETSTPKEYMPKCKVVKKDTLTFITYYFPAKVSLQNQVCYFEDYIIIPIASAIRDLICQEFAIQYAKDIINQSTEFILSEKRSIVHIFEEIWGAYFKEINSNLLTLIIEELMNENAITIEGWMQFRLLNYKEYIKNIVERIMFEYMTYIEYKEFLLLLKQFIEAQESMMDIVQIMPNQNGEIHLYDKNNKEITKKCIEQYSEGINDPNSSIEDEILSALIAIAPMRIIIHKKEKCNNRQFIDTIQRIYEGKVYICQNCEYCNKIIDIS